ncbi:ParA family protein [Ferroglobus sp.]|uniref:ParA family protein n=1 Tax=Ferroglobus sp. TaxID=2614230 RepID=UPI0025C5A6B4|nr:AAA family ATPase [Ferroglobus sp.]
MKVLSLHSFKGGTGKTFIALNLAYLLSEKNKVCIVDLDLVTLSLYSFFSSEFYLNDLLYRNRDLEDCIVRVSENLHAILASPDVEDIRRELRKDDRMEMRTLERLMILKQKIEDFNYVILDTHPDLSYFSVNSLILSDVVFLVLRPDRMTWMGQGEF